MPHADGHWTESKVNPGWYHGFGKNNPNPINQPAPEPGMTPNITNQAEYNRNLNRNQRGGQYVIQSTGEPYSGLVLHYAGKPHTTRTGAYEGNKSKELVLASEYTGQPFRSQRQEVATQNQNPVTRLFTAPSSPRYYRPDGTIVAVGAKLHQHQDGTIMTEHSMTANDNSVVVTTTAPRVVRGRRTRARTQRPVPASTMTRTQRANMNRPTTRTTQTQTTRRRTMTTRRNGGGSGGGSGGGY